MLKCENESFTKVFKVTESTQVLQKYVKQYYEIVIKSTKYEIITKCYRSTESSVLQNLL